MDTVQNMMVKVGPVMAWRPSDDTSSREGQGFETSTDEKQHAPGCPPEAPVAVEQVNVPTSVPFEGPVRILVVGASPEIREQTVRCLQTHGGPGWEPDAVGETGSARTRLMLETWDVVLLRLDAGPLDYRDIFRSIRAARKWPPPSVVAVLETDPAVQAELRGLGVSRMLLTPFSVEQLVGAVRHGLADGSRDHMPWWDTDQRQDDQHSSDDPLV